MVAGARDPKKRNLTLPARESCRRTCRREPHTILWHHLHLRKVIHAMTPSTLSHFIQITSTGPPAQSQQGNIWYPKSARFFVNKKYLLGGGTPYQSNTVIMIFQSFPNIYISHTVSTTHHLMNVTLNRNLLLLTAHFIRSYFTRGISRQF